MRTRLVFYDSVEARRCGCTCSSSRGREATAGTLLQDHLRSSCRWDETILSQNTGSPLPGLLSFSCHRDFSAVHLRSGQTLPAVTTSEKTSKGK
ncbi:hypothetical protein NDU88_007543 [Pleurodeles waltl]|uniref:Uncharacterized protein n=1 Tax=Pleurodeles waltl TaxID=8319 RepID=A0AAV7NWY0_PLEWA|nr:hypothetical protein NDU88_007543 [Pleurodeles waltl]